MALAQRSAAEREALAALVRKHKVVYEIYPQKSYVTGHEVNIGYDVELLGMHAGGTHGVWPGCPRCTEVWEDLRRIGEAVIPEDIHRVSRYEIMPFDFSIHFGRGRREEVRLALAIRHKRDYQAPIDPCEERCLHDIVADLKSLGAREKEWTNLPSSPIGG